MADVEENREQVQWERMLPREFRAAMEKLPVVFLPLGTIERLAKLAPAMVHWDMATRRAFVRAERALVDAQVRGWRLQQPWAAWKTLGSKRLTRYGALLAAQDFTGIESIAEQL